MFLWAPCWTSAIFRFSCDCLQSLEDTDTMDSHKEKTSWVFLFCNSVKAQVVSENVCVFISIWGFNRIAAWLQIFKWPSKCSHVPFMWPCMTSLAVLFLFFFFTALIIRESSLISNLVAWSTEMYHPTVRTGFCFEVHIFTCRWCYRYWTQQSHTPGSI